MNKRKVLCLLLIFAIAVSFVSCEYVDKVKGFFDKEVNDEHVHSNNCDCYLRTEDGYTGGITDRKEFHDKYEVYWLEEYDEVVAAIEMLESHGSTINRSLGFTYENELLDSKYCFIFEKSNVDPLADGKSFFDRKIDGGEFVWYGFYDQITIAELMYTTVYDLDTVTFAENFNASRSKFDAAVVDTIEDIGKLGLYDIKKNTYGTTDHPDIAYYIGYNGAKFARLTYLSSTAEKKLLLPVDNQREFLDTFVIIH